MDRTLIKIDRKVFYLFLGLILVCGVYVIATNLYTDQNLFGHQIYNATIGWTNLTGYPVACPSGSAITQLDDSVTCTAYNDVTTFNATGAIAGETYHWFEINGSTEFEEVGTYKAILHAKIADNAYHINACFHKGPAISGVKRIYPFVHLFYQIRIY